MTVGTPPDHPGTDQATLDQAVALHRDGQLAQAARLYQALLDHRPDHADALHLLGVLTAQARPDAAGGRDASALIARAAALTPERADIHANHARALAQAGDSTGATAAARAAAGRDPAHWPLLAQMGAQAGDAAAVLDAFAALAAAAMAQGRREEARHWYRQTLALTPDDALALSNMGESLRQDGDYAGALPWLRQAVTASGGALLPACALADTLQELGQHEDALSLLDGLLAATPPSHSPAAPAAHQALAWRALAQVRRLTGDTGGALAAYERALALAPDDAPAQVGRAMSLLRLGHYAQGFAAYAARWRLAAHPPRHQDLPRWTGDAPRGMDLLVWHEQGVGDTLQCLRFLPILLRAGVRVTLEVPAPLEALLRTAPGLAGIPVLTPPQVAARKAAGTTPWRAQIPFMDLAGLLCPGPDAVPTPLGVLAPDPARRRQWADWLDAHAPAATPRVGLFWQGNPAFPEDRWRSPGLASLAPLLAVPGVCFVNLQLGGGAALMATGAPALDPGMANQGAAIADWADTAALMANLDLVIGSDTACLHLAGSLGLPTWLIVSTTTDWRWHDGRTDSPWYPSVRLFRQQRLGDWTAPVVAAAAALAKWVSGPRAPRA